MDLENMTIRQVSDVTQFMTIQEGGLRIMIEKIVRDIEELQKNTVKKWEIEE